jgi:hypothetical protein
MEAIQGGLPMVPYGLGFRRFGIPLVVAFAVLGILAAIGDTVLVLVAYWRFTLPALLALAALYWHLISRSERRKAGEAPAKDELNGAEQLVVKVLFLLFLLVITVVAAGIAVALFGWAWDWSKDNWPYIVIVAVLLGGICIAAYFMGDGEDKRRASIGADSDKADRIVR